MQIKLVVSLLILSTITAIAGDGKIVVAPAPPPPPLFGREFQISLWGDGVWTQTVAHQDRYFGTDHAFGGSVKVKYFFDRYFGIGLEGGGYDVRNTLGPNFGGSHRFVGDALASFTARYPINNFLNGALAPYASIGVGGVFNGGNKTLIEPSATVGKLIKFEQVEHDAKLMLQPVVGVEYRFTKNWGVFTEGFFSKITRPQSNTFGGRVGVGYAF